MQQSNKSSVYQAFQASSLMYLFLDQVWWFFKLVAQCKLWLATFVAHLVKPATLKHHATKQQIICFSSVSSVKLDVPFLDQVWWFFKLVAQCKLWLATTVHISWSQWVPNIMQQSNKSSVYQAFQASSLMYLFLDQVWWFFKLVAQCKLWLATTVAHLVKPATLKHHATKQDVIFLSSVSSVKLDVPFLDQVWWFFKLVAQCKLWFATSVAHLVKPATLKHHATEQQIICLSSVSSVKLDVPFLDQVWWFFKLVAQCKLWLATTVHILWSQWVPNIMQQSNKSSFCQAFQASSLMYLFLDQVWWFFKLVAQCKVWLATSVAHLVKPATLKHHATKQQIICLSSVSSVKLDVPFSWPSVVVLQVGSTVQTMIGYHCAHLVKLVSTKHHATEQQIICLSSVSSVKLDVPFSWPSVVVLQVGSTVQTMIRYHCAHLVKPVSIKHHATKQQIICLSSVSSVKLDVPFLDQVWWFFKLVAQCKLWLATTVHILWSQWVPNIMQQSNKSSVYQAFQASSLMYLFLDQVWWFFKLVAQCKLWLATTVAHLVKPATLKHHATKQDVIFLSSVSSVKLDVPFLDQVWWFFKLVAQCKLWLATSVAHLVKPATLKHHAAEQ